jgi:RNA polymerase sigma factor (sigma-70 family)
MNLLAKLDALDAEWLDWPESHDDASPFDFAVWRGRLFVGFTYRSRYVTAPASIIHGGIAHGRLVYTKDERKRIKTEPHDPSLIAASNGRVESMPRNRNVQWKPRHEKRVVEYYPLRNEIRRTPAKEFFGIPLFDRGSFKNSAVDELAEKLDKDDIEIREWLGWLVGKAIYKGSVLLATWQYGNVGNASPTVTRPAPPHERLWAAARPSDKIRTEQAFRLADGSLHCFPLAILPWGAHCKHLPWVNRDAVEVEKNAKRYRLRLNAAANRYDDLLRWNGKATCGFDITYTQAAQRGGQDKLLGREPTDRDPVGCDGYLTKNGNENGEDWKDAWQDYRLPLLLWVLVHQPPWFILSVLRKPAALFSLYGTSPYLIPTEGKRFSIPPRWYAHLEGVQEESAYYSVGKVTVRNRFLSERDVLKDETSERNKNLESARPAYEFPEAEMLSRKEELEYFRRWESDGDPEAANAIYEAHRPLFINIAKQYATGDLTVEDLLVDGYTGEKNEKTGRHRTGLFCCLENYDPFRGRISTFLTEPFEWACADSRRRHRIRKRQEHASLNAPIGGDNEDGEGGDTWQDMAVAEVSDGEEYDEQHQARLAALKECLTEQERQVLILRHVDGHSRREVAEACGITQDKVRWIETKATALANPKN